MILTLPISVRPIIPDETLPDANWADAYEISTRRHFKDMRELALSTVGTMPVWAKFLLRIRNIVVAPFGLKPDGKGDAPNPNARVGIFPILQEHEDRIVLGLDDAHLDFRIVIERQREGNGHRIRATTLVKRHNAFGRIYIAAITPFHKLIVKAALKQAVIDHSGGKLSAHSVDHAPKG